MEIKLLYKDGGTCDSHIHIYHNHDDKQSLTGASLGLTQAHDPWAIQVITTLDRSDKKESLATKLSFRSPLLTTPFQLNGMYSIAENHLDFEVQAGLEEQSSLSFSGKNYLESGTEVFFGMLEFDTPWTELMLLNMTSTRNKGSFNITLDLRSSWDPIKSVAAEFSAIYAVPNDTKAHFYLSHDHLQVVMELAQKLTDSGLNSHFQGSANTVRVISHFNTKWNEDFIPMTSSGQFSATNLFDHKLDLTLSHAKESDTFYTQLFGSWDNQTLTVDHKLDFKQPLEWLSVFQITLPGQDEVIETELQLNAQPDVLFANLDLALMSPWTEDFRVKVALEMSDSVKLFEIDSLKGDSSIIRLALQSTGPFYWYQSDLSFEVNSIFSDNYDIKWKHNFVTKNLVLIEVTHGTYFYGRDNGFYFKGTSNLLYNEGLYGQEFAEFDFNVILNFPSPQLDFKSKVNIDSQFNGGFEVKLNDHTFSVTSALFDGTVFRIRAGLPKVEYEIELKYDEGNSNIPDLHFRFTQNTTDIFIFTSKFDPIYPRFDAVLTVSTLMETNGSIQKGQLRMMADMTNIQDYAFKGLFKLESDFEGFKNFWAEVDIAMDERSGYIGGHLNGLLHIDDWHYKTILKGSIGLHRNFSLEYRNEYELIYGEQLFDRKLISLLIDITGRDVYNGKLAVQVGPKTPQWSFFIYYRQSEKKFKSFVIPDNSEKYELSAHVDGNRLSIDAQIIGEEGLKFQVLKGNINWNIRKKKKQFILNMNSDYTAFRKITGQILIQQKRGLAANAKFKVNQENFTGSLRYISQGARNSGKIILKVENEIYVDFKVDTNINFSVAHDKYESDLVFDLNDQKGWFTANMKGSLPESYLQLKMPYEGFENIELIVNINLEENWGVKVTMQTPKFCGNLESTLDKYFKNFSISAKIQADCTGEAIFKFNFSYSVEKYESFNIASYCHIHDYGLIYKFEISGKVDAYETDLIMEGKVYPQHSLGVAFCGTWHRENVSLSLRAYDLYNNLTHFLYRHSFLPTNTDIIFELNQSQLLSLQVEYENEKEHHIIDAIYSHLLFGFPLNIKFTVEASMTETTGSIEMLLTTDSAFDHADLFITYDRKEKDEGTFTLSTTLGGAEGKIIFQDTENSHSIKADMISSLHSFKEYHIQFDQESDNYRIEIVGVKDDTQYQIKYSVIKEDNETIRTLNLKTPFKEYENFNFGIVYPQPDILENPYQAYINVVLYGDLYGIDVNHNHQESWRSQKTEIMFTTPTEVFGNVSVSVMYDESGKAELQFDTFQGSLGMIATWQHLETSFIFSLNSDLTLFDFGEYVFYADIPLIYSKNGEIRFEWHQTDLDFIGQVITGGSFTHANISCIVLKSDPVPQNTTYMLSYELEDSLQIFGQFEVWEALAVLKFEGNEIPLASGTFEVSTNIEGYEAIEGLWDIKQKDQEYLALIDLDIKDQGTVAFRATLDIQPESIPIPWDKMKLEILFESPFTLTHHLQAECQFSTLIIEASYKHGLNTFQVKLSSEFKQMEGTLLLTANIPVQGISTCDFNFNYILKEAYSISLTAVVEETTLQTGLELASDGAVGSVISSLTSPFVRPMKTTLNWSFIENAMLLEATYAFEKYSGELKMNLEYTSNAKKLEFYMRTPIEMLSKFDFLVHYSYSESNQIHFTADLTFNDQTFKTELVYMNNSPKISIDLSGFMDAFGITGSVQITFGKTSDVYEGRITSEIKYYKPLDFILTLDTEHIESSVKYGTANVLIASLNFSHIDIQFVWKDYSFFNLTANLTPANNGYLFELILHSSETKPVTLYFTYSDTEGHEGNARVTVGETEYNIRGTLYAHKRKSVLEFQLDSSENLHTPIRVNAMYDIKNFLKGKMNSMMDLASITFEWEEQFHLNVTGMRNRNRAKVNVEISTPLKFLPQLRFGYDGEFSMKKLYNIDLTFTAFAEWPERITLTGFFQLMNEKVALHVALTTPYSGYEKLSVSFKFNSGHFEAAMVFNNDEWNILCNYELSPTFSLNLSAKTPVNGFETLSLITSAGLQEGFFRAQAELSWLNTTAVRIQIQAEMWRLSLHVNTPWKIFGEVLFITSLRTESEELMFTGVLHWNEKKTEMTLIYSPERFHFAWKYEENSVVIGLVWAEYSINDQEFKFEVEIKTPYKSFTSLKVVLHLGPQDKDFIVKLNMNDMGYVIEGMYSVSGGKFLIDIPVLREFMWTLEARNMWMDVDTQATFIYPKSTVPLTATLTYEIQPVNKEANLDIKFEAPYLRLESLNFSMTATYGDHLQFINASSTLFVKVRNEESSKHEVNITSSVIVDQVSLTIDLESDYVVIPYRIKGKFPLFNFFLEKGVLEFVVTEGGEQIYRLFYETSLLDEHSSSRLMELVAPEWVAGIQVIVDGELLNISFSYPEPASKHSLLLKWSEDFSFEKFTIGAEFHSPYLDEGKFKFDLDFMVKEKFTYALDSIIYHGSKNIDLRGIFQYTDSLYQVKGDLQVQSNWIGMHSMEAVIQWLRDITAEIKLNSLNKEHSVRLHIDSTDYTLSLKCNSPWLPYENIMMKGKINSNFDPFYIQLEGQFEGTTDGNEILFTFMSEGFQNTTYHISINEFWYPVFKISGLTKSDDIELIIDISVASSILDLDTGFNLHLKNVDEMRYIEAKFLNYLLDSIHVKITDMKFWINDLKIYFDYKDYHFKVELDIEQGHVYCRIKTPLEDFKYFKINTHWLTSNSKRIFEVIFRGRYDEAISLEVEGLPDSVMGWSVFGSLRTPFKGYEMFLFQTPQFNYKNNVFTVMLEYPGGKAGIAWRIDADDPKSDFQFSIYLPFEEYDIISLKYGYQNGKNKDSIGMEVRVSKVGITLTSSLFHSYSVVKIESLVRVNEYSMKAIITHIDLTRHNFKIKFHFDFSPKELLGIHFFTTEFKFIAHERTYFEARNDQEELLKVHIAWGPDKVFSITTPKRYPGYLILNLESAKELDDYQLQVGLTFKDGPWEIYGFHVHQEILEAGRHLSLSGKASESQFYIEGTFSLNSMHCNQSLIFELNRKRMGYKVQFQRKPGVFNSLYIGNTYLIIPSRTVQFKTNVLSNSRELDMLSSFAWNKYDPEMPPLTFRLNYNDHSLFGDKRHYLKAVFSHPDIKDVILQGNITQSRNSPLYGLAELSEEDSSERNIVLALSVQPVTDNEEHIINVSISQPFSGFVLSMDAQVVKSVFSKGDYTFKYWSLTKKSWENLKIVTTVDTTDHGYDFAANFHTSQSKWGYSYRGNIQSWNNSAMLDIQGISREFGEFWKFGTIVKKHLPQLLVSLDIGQEDKETYEGGRVRIGIHNPVEIGAVLDHQRFGEWIQDCTVGLKLKISDILQFFLEFDPSLDYRDEAFWTHLTSPADKILDAWWRDLNITASALKKLILIETPAIIDVLVDKQTLQAVWERETGNFNLFIGEVKAAILDTSEDVTLAWMETVQRLLVNAHSFTMNV